MPPKSANFLARGDIPEFYGLVTTARSQGFTIGAETDTQNRIAMPPKSANFLARGDIPEFDSFVLTARSQGFTIGAETGTIKFMNATREDGANFPTKATPAKGTDFLAGGDIPELDFIGTFRS